MANENIALRRAVSEIAESRNQPIAVINHATGPHACDLLGDTDTTRAILRQVLDVLRAQLAS